MGRIIFKDESYRIQGAVVEVYKEMGSGFLEAVCQECLKKELNMQGIPFVAQPVLVLEYKSEKLEQIHRPDLICYGKIIIELKAVKAIAAEHKAQMLNYLRASRHKLGVLANFGAYPKAEIIRLVL